MIYTRSKKIKLNSASLFEASPLHYIAVFENFFELSWNLLISCFLVCVYYGLVNTSLPRFYFNNQGGQNII